jgi:hypothetical protein
MEGAMTLSIIRDKKSQDWMLVVLAAALFVSPWIMGFHGVAMAAWCAWIFAVILAGLAFASLREVDQWEEWVTALVGLWLVAAPWLLGFSEDVGARGAYMVIGLLTIVVSLWAEWSFRHPFHPPGSQSMV